MSLLDYFVSVQCQQWEAKFKHSGHDSLQWNTASFFHYYDFKTVKACAKDAVVWPAVPHGSSCFGLWDAMHAGPQFNAQNGGTIEKFCSSHPSLSRLHTISLVSHSDTVVRRSKSVETSAFNLRVTEQSEGRDGASAVFSVCRQSVWATDARLS